MSSSANKIVLKSSDEATFEIEETVARQIQIVSHMIDDDCADKPIPLQNVTGKILSLVLEYCNKHVADASADTSTTSSEEEKKEEEEKKKTELDSWDAEFMEKLDKDTIFQIILAANYLNTKSLLDLACQNIADYIKDKKVEEVREIFGIENDFTTEEEAKVREENAWAFD